MTPPDALNNIENNLDYLIINVLLNPTIELPSRNN